MVFPRVEEGRLAAAAVQGFLGNWGETEEEIRCPTGWRVGKVRVGKNSKQRLAFWTAIVIGNSRWTQRTTAARLCKFLRNLKENATAFTPGCWYDLHTMSSASEWRLVKFSRNSRKNFLPSMHAQRLRVSAWFNFSYAQFFFHVARNERA